jgi:phage shock protein PspC (stress-responsive transcriptional regulator)
MLSGVCGGLGEYFNIDPTLVRIGVAALTLFTGGTGLIAYGIAWIVMPEADGTPTVRQVQDQFDKRIRRPEEDIAARIYNDEPAPAANGTAKTGSTDGNGTPAA